MKNGICILLGFLFLSSCSTILTSRKQTITFYSNGDKHVRLFDEKGKEVGQTNKDGFVSVEVRKKLASPIYTAITCDCRHRKIELQSRFNAVSYLNILFLPGFIVDISTGKLCRYKKKSYVIDAR